MLKTITGLLLVKLSRVLPDPVSYRLDFALIKRQAFSDITFDNSVPFGSSRIRSSFKDHNDRRFALHWTNSLVGLSLATVVVRSGDVVYELGSNVGTETLALANLVGPTGLVVAVEPSEKCFTTLNGRLQRNGIGNVRLLRVAASAAAGWMRFDEGTASNTGTGHGFDWSAQEIKSGVQAISLDELLPYGHPSCFFFYIEGAGWQAIWGGPKIMTDVRPIIFSELHGFALARAGNSVAEFCNAARALNYRVFDANGSLKREFTIPAQEEKVFTDVIMVPEERLGIIKAARRTILLYKLFPWLLSKYWNPLRRWF